MSQHCPLWLREVECRLKLHPLQHPRHRSSKASTPASHTVGPRPEHRRSSWPLRRGSHLSRQARLVIIRSSTAPMTHGLIMRHRPALLAATGSLHVDKPVPTSTNLKLPSQADGKQVSSPSGDVMRWHLICEHVLTLFIICSKTYRQILFHAYALYTLIYAEYLKK